MSKRDCKECARKKKLQMAIPDEFLGIFNNINGEDCYQCSVKYLEGVLCYGPVGSSLQRELELYKTAVRILYNAIGICGEGPCDKYHNDCEECRLDYWLKEAREVLNGRRKED